MKKRITGVILALALCVSLAAPAAASSTGKAGQYQTFAAGIISIYAVKADGSLWACGKNGSGQLGIGTTSNSSYSPFAKIMDGVASVSAGGYSAMAIKTDGSLWGWGYNGFGQLGDGTETNRPSPVKIMDGVAAVSAGYSSAMAIKTDGSLWAWGDNFNGQLGDGTTESRLSPVKIMDGVAAVSAGSEMTAAVKTDGSLWGWGYNYFGQLGIGKTTGRQSVPVKIMDGAATVSVGNSHTMAVKTDGSLWGWGYNSSGQLGLGTTSGRSSVTGAAVITGYLVSAEQYQTSPVKIMDGVASVSASGSYTMAVKTDGSLWGWGANPFGSLGDGTKESRLNPVKIMDGVSAVNAAYVDGGAYTAAVKTDGSLWVWGDYNSNALGVDEPDELMPHKLLDGVRLSGAASVTPPTPPPAALTAKPTASAVLVNGIDIVFNAYNISDNNYFKLRDLAFVLNGTGKQFSVGYDETTKAIALTSGQAYTPVGGEMTGKETGGKTPTPTSSKITLDGKEVTFTAYAIDGNNYFKLRDVGEAFGFGVDWDGARNTIVIDTS